MGGVTGNPRGPSIRLGVWLASPFASINDRWLERASGCDHGALNLPGRFRHSRSRPRRGSDFSLRQEVPDQPGVRLPVLLQGEVTRVEEVELQILRVQPVGVGTGWRESGIFLAPDDQRRRLIRVPGNHAMKLLKKLRGEDVQITHGPAVTLGEINTLEEGVRGPIGNNLAAFQDGLNSHSVIDDRKLVAAHAGLEVELQGRESAKIREFARYGKTTGETDGCGLPVRRDWASENQVKRWSSTGIRPSPSPSGSTAW